MTDIEKSAVIGYWRQGATYMEIALIFGVSAYYIEIIVKEYLADKKETPD